MIVQAPTYFQTPNDLVDHWLPHLGECEVKVLLVIFRKTFGWHKKRDEISLSQMVKLTGSTATNIGNAVKSLVSKGIILKETIGPIGSQHTYYELIVNEESNNSYPSQVRSPPPPTAGAPPLPQRESQKKPLKESLKENLPPLSPPKVSNEKPTKKEEEDFSFLDEFKFSAHETKQLMQFQPNAVKRAIAIAKHHKVKTSYVGMLLNILKNPAKWPDPEQLQEVAAKKQSEVRGHFDYAPLNASYWTQILRLVTEYMIRDIGTINAAQGWHSKGLRECGSYLEDQNGQKIYMKDATFLDQVRNFFLKKGIELKCLHDFIDQCKIDLQKNCTLC